MTTLITIILGLLAVILALIVLAASMYLAIVAAHELRWKRIKSEKYEQYNGNKNEEEKRSPDSTT